MQRFIRNIFAALFLFAAIAGLTAYVLYAINTKTVNSYRFKPGTKILFCGDSHVMMTIDDAQLPGSANIADAGEPVIYSYYKARKLVAGNPAIRRIYLGFSYHSLSVSCNRFISGKYAKDMAARYFYLLPAADRWAIYRSHWREAHRFVAPLIYGSVNSIRAGKGKAPSVGGYDNPYARDTTFYKMKARAAELFPPDSSGQCAVCTSNIYYLQQMAAWCRNSNIELILLDMPMHPYIRALIPDCISAAYRKAITDSGLPVMHFGDMPLDDYCFAPDGDHLSQKGAQRITAYLKKRGY